jgi:lincosamide nucleotidyltransferase A/C/D/E
VATTEADAAEILGVLGAAEPRLAGGWGVDALAGRQTREHRDLDVMVPAHRLEAALEALEGIGFAVTTDWLPVRVEVSHGQRHVDLHPLHLAADGSAWQAGLDGTRFEYPTGAWTTGSIAGRDVLCLTAAHQRALRAGYAHREQDRHDLAVLASLGEQP